VAGAFFDVSHRMTEISAAALLRTPDQRAGIKRLMIFFALVYFAEGMCQNDGIIAQPLNYYLKQVYQWTPVQIAAFLTVFNLPWFIKPLYGIVSDFVPLLGYRRKTYLIAASGLAAAGYFLILDVSSPGSLMFLLLLTAYGMAIASTLCGALLVEKGQRFDSCNSFVNLQWLWFNVAAIFASLAGGFLIERLLPLSAVRGAAVLAGLTAMLVIAGTFMLVDEEKSTMSLAGLKDSLHGLAGAFKDRRLWLIAFFLFFYFFSPGIDTPLYFYMTDSLKFSQQFIGVLRSIQAVGWIAAALFYAMFLEHLSLRALLYWSVAVGVVAPLAFVFMSGPATGVIANFCYGVSEMMVTVASLGLAANYCPKRAEGFSFAALMAIANLSGSLADNVGSFLFEHVFNNELYPLILVAAAVTAVNFVLVPLLGLKDETASQNSARV